ncbi:hypothetical protein J1605_001785 [Eschrichtius robustus]|uniref:C2H2-type domain-containing protein n=1 Tax=Eschrichtius robustus TaxID=9764 RepID=A0AB34I0L5_ESCRO|nr:hypothetical protein J1605_001785 [Eschrichtius robustus]
MLMKDASRASTSEPNRREEVDSGKLVTWGNSEARERLSLGAEEQPGFSAQATAERSGPDRQRPPMRETPGLGPCPLMLHSPPTASSCDRFLHLLLTKEKEKTDSGKEKSAAPVIQSLKRWQRSLFRKSSEELDMDKVTAAMVLTSLSTSPLVRSPPVRQNGEVRLPGVRDWVLTLCLCERTEGLSGSWKEGGGVPSSTSSSGYWSWSAPSDQSNPSTPSPPLSADSFKPFRSPAPPDDGIDEAEASNLLFDEPIPRKRKLLPIPSLLQLLELSTAHCSGEHRQAVRDVRELQWEWLGCRNSMKVMFKCLWKNCGKVLSTAVGIQKHIRTIHLGRVGESDYSDGEEDFYYTEIKLNTDSVADGLSSLAPVSPSQSLASPPTFPIPDSSRTETPCAKTETKLMTPLSRSAPTTLYLVHTDHAYQATPPVNIPGSAKFTPNGSNFSISWQSPPVTFTGIPVSPTHSHPVGTGEQRQHTHTVLSSPPRGTVSLRKPRGEGKKCRKVYGMENRDMWCTACRWKKACQRFID